MLATARRGSCAAIIRDARFQLRVPGFHVDPFQFIARRQAAVAQDGLLVIVQRLVHGLRQRSGDVEVLLDPPAGEGRDERPPASLRLVAERAVPDAAIPYYD